MIKISFGSSGCLPAPDGLEAPLIFLANWGDLVNRPGWVQIKPDKPTDYPPTYLFAPLRPEYWTAWDADGMEDCEVGRATFRATAPNGQRYSWTVHFAHDGDPALEFWGAVFPFPPVLLDPEPTAPTVQKGLIHSSQMPPIGKVKLKSPAPGSLKNRLTDAMEP